jgi:glyoxylase-like metal-dependent hydrolase (beta-lactamase superfamily II)
VQIETFYHPNTCTFTYLVLDEASRKCALIDTVLDYDPKAGRITTTSADKLVERVHALNGVVEWLLDTHLHADHLSANAYLQRKLGGRLGIGNKVTQVQKIFKGVFNLDDSFQADGSQFDRLFSDGESFDLGAVRFTVLHTPGHTPACVSYVIAAESRQVIVVGDTVFMPDLGTGRCDFPGGDAAALYRSIQRLFAYPGETELLLCHDYPPDDRALSDRVTVAESRAKNSFINDAIDETAFVGARKAQDATLSMPTLILPSIQVNIRGGNLPEPEANGIRYLKIPLNAL